MVVGDSAAMPTPGYRGLHNGAADADHNQSITVGEPQTNVIEGERHLTAGSQNPIVRRENLDYDFEIY